MQKPSPQGQGITEKRFEILLPEEVVGGFGWAEDEVSARVREVLVMALLRWRTVSQRKAAELLQLNRWDLFEVMGKYKVPTIDLTPEEHHLSLSRLNHGQPRVQAHPEVLELPNGSYTEFIQECCQYQQRL